MDEHQNLADSFRPAPGTLSALRSGAPRRSRRRSSGDEVMRIAVYLRFSSERQSTSSLEDQLRLCRALAQRNGWTVVAVYQDAAMSGALRDRKGYLGLVADALSGRFDLVVAESLDRLNRDLEETARLYKRLKFVGVGIHTVSEGPISEVHVSISGLMGEMYLKSLAEKTRRGLEGRVLAGKSGGGRSFGYDLATGLDASGPGGPASGRSMRPRPRSCARSSAGSPPARGRAPSRGP